MTTRMEKSDSFSSIPDIGLFQSMTFDDIEKENMSEFKMMEKKGQLKPEPLLIEDKSRFVLFPIKHTDVSSQMFLTFVFIILTFFPS
jgi:hypothetical protein